MYRTENKNLKGEEGSFENTVKHRELSKLIVRP